MHDTSPRGVRKPATGCEGQVVLNNETTVTPQTKARILVVDDHQIFAEMLAEALTGSGFRVTGTCCSLADALDHVACDPPDVVILDHSLPSGTGAGGVAAIKHLGPRVLMLTSSREHGVVQEAMDAGCDGFVTKAQSLAAVIDAVHAVHRGETPLSADVAGSILGRPPTSIGNDLTFRESGVLQLIGAGFSNQQIANEFRISPNTVRNHVSSVLAKLNAHSKLEAAAIAARNGLLTADRSSR